MAGATPGRAFFGPPSSDVVPGGTQITVYLVPVFEGGLVVFDVAAKEARGRWLPWDVLDFRQNPYEAAAALADTWCNVPLDDLRIVDVMSFPAEGGGWELAISFRAELAEMAPGDEHRRPFRFEPGSYDAIGPFDPVDIERWVRSRGAADPPAAGEKLVF
jgi:hypothetical protein